MSLRQYSARPGQWQATPPESDIVEAFFRTGFIIAFAALATAAGPFREAPVAWAGVILAAVYSVLMVLIARLFRPPLTWQRFFSLLVDIIMVSCVIASYGFAASGIKDCYYIIIFAAGMWFQAFGAFVVGLMSAIAFVIAYSTGTGITISQSSLISLLWGEGAIFMPIAGVIMGFLFKAYATELQQLAEIEHEIALARRLQDRMLPSVPPSLRGWEIAAQMRRAGQVGGDFYAFHTFDDGSTLIALADMAGRSVHGLVHLSLIHSHLLTIAAQTRDLATLADELNRRAYPQLQPDSYAAAVFVCVGPNSDTVRFVNCGHLPPLLILPNEGEVTELSTGDPIIGAQFDYSYREATVHAPPGALLVCYTDGLVEQRNRVGEMFGEERLRRFLLAHSSLSPSELCAALLAEVERFSGARTPSDDQTLVILRRLPA